MLFSKRICLLATSLIFCLACKGTQVREEYYPDGKLKQRSHYDPASGVLQGAIEKYSPDGSLESVENYEQNTENGYFCSYYPNGRLKMRELRKPHYSKDNSSNTVVTIIRPVHRITYHFSPYVRKTSLLSSAILAVLPSSWGTCSSLKENIDPIDSRTEFNAGIPVKTIKYDEYHREIKRISYSRLGNPITDESLKLFEQGNSQFKQHKYNDAVENFKAALQDSPQFSEALSALALSYMSLHQYTDAVEACDRALIIRPKDPDILFMKCLTLVLAGQKEVALESCQQSSLIKPQAKTFLWLATIHHFMKHSEEALAALEKAKQLAPEDSAIFLELGDINSDLEKYDLAEINYKQSLQLSPKSGDILYKLGKINLILGKKEAASDYFTQASEALSSISPDSPKYEPAQRLLDNIQTSMGHFGKIYERLTQRINAEPSDDDARFEISLLLDDAGDRVSAIQFLQEGLPRSNNNVTYRYNLAEALFYSGDLETAKKHLLEVSTKNENNLALLAQIYMIQDNTNEAIRAANDSLKSNAVNNALAHQVLMKLAVKTKDKSSLKTHTNAYNSAISELVANLKKPDPSIKRTTTWKLGMNYWLDPSIMPHLLTATNDPNPNVVVNALWGLGLTASPKNTSLATTLLGLTDHPNSLVRYRAILTAFQSSAITTMTNLEFIKLIHPLLETPNDPLIERIFCLLWNNPEMNKRLLSIKASETLESAKKAANNYCSKIPQ